MAWHRSEGAAHMVSHGSRVMEVTCLDRPPRPPGGSDVALRPSARGRLRPAPDGGSRDWARTIFGLVDALLDLTSRKP